MSDKNVSQHSQTSKSKSPSDLSEHPFTTIQPAPALIESKVPVVDSKEVIYQKTEKGELIEEVEPQEKKKNSTILGSSFMLTNLCLGTTIFTFAVRAKAFGLVWFLVVCVVVAIVNYWSIMRCVYASSKCKKDDYSEITEEILGRKTRVVLNIFIILYSYGFCMCYCVLIYSLFGRFIQSLAYNKDYVDYNEFYDKRWGKAYIKYPFYAGVGFCLSLMCLIKDINKLSFSAYIGVGACSYALIVVLVQCYSYYKYYRDTIYKADDESTHPNWINISDAFTKKMDFFKGISTLFAAYACHPGIFPVYAGFKQQRFEDKNNKDNVNNEETIDIKKMKYSTFFGTLLTTILHFISITCSFLTNPYDPEDLIVFRKNKGNDKDIFMTLAKLFVAISLVFTFPGYYFTLRLSIANSCTKGQISNKFNYIVTFLSCFGCCLVAAVYDKVLNYLNYIGGFLSVYICYLNPILLCIKKSGKPFTHWKNILELSISILLSLIGIIAGILTIIDDVTG